MTDSALTPSPQPRGRLPTPLSSFIGRDQEIEAIVELVCQSGVRLVTLTGPGGVGKTRLAVQGAERLQPFFPDGVVSVSLAPIREPGLVLAAIAQALGVRDALGQSIAQQLADVLHGRAMLLVLDNFEQVVDAAPDIATLLGACPNLKALVTSRTVLHLSGEHDVAIGPLTLPAPRSKLSVESIAASPAVQLFVQRAQAAASDFRLTEANALTVVGICRQVDSLPLAIELAAARVAHLPLSALLDRLERRLPLLTGGARNQLARHRTMRDTIAWSYDLLAPDEQALFRRLAVFVGGFTLEAADALGGDGATDILEAASSLADKSLLRSDDSQGTQPRYLMLETVREFGSEQLANAGEEDVARAAHAAYFLELAERTEPLLSGPSALSGYAELERERGNLRAALAWFDSAGEAEDLLRLAAALGYFWEMVGPLSEGDSWLERALARSTQPTPTRVRALISLATNASYQGKHDKSEALHRAALDLARQLGIPKSRSTTFVTIADILQNLGTHYVDQGQYAEGVESLNQALAEARQAGDREREALVLTHLGIAAWGQERATEALELLEAGRALGIEAGYPLPAAVSSRYLAHIAIATGELAVAAERFREFWSYDPTGDHVLARLVPDLPALAVALGAPERAAELFGAAQALAQETGLADAWPEQGLHERAAAHARAVVGDHAFEAASAAGASLPRDELLHLVEAVLQEAERERENGLTERDLTLIRLFVNGHSNQEIADTLGLDPSAVIAQIGRMYTALGVDSRAEVAAYAFRHGIV